MNEVNHMAAKNNEAFLSNVKVMFEIFGEVRANLSPAFGGQSLEIRTDEDLQSLEEIFTDQTAHRK